MGFMEDLLRSANEDNRRIERYEKDELVIDTCSVFDQPKPYKYETGIRHPAYDNGNWVIVELYKTEPEAVLGHKRWVKEMTAKELPYQLKDVSDILVTKMLDTFSGKKWRTRINKTALN